jgi:K+-sensing histidine kinase KdpD
MRAHLTAWVLHLTAFDGKAGDWLSGTYIPLRAAFAGRRSRGSGLRALLFSTECALGIVSVMLVGVFAHWLQWLLPVAVLLYLLIIVPTALWCGFWQAVIVSLSAVAVQSYFAARQGRLNPAADPANSITLVAFILTALVISRLSARVTEHARATDSWGGQMQDLYEFTRRTLQMNLHVEPGAQLAELVHEIFAL